jgi:hypothetical protein
MVNWLAPSIAPALRVGLRPSHREVTDALRTSVTSSFHLSISGKASVVPDQGTIRYAICPNAIDGSRRLASVFTGHQQRRALPDSPAARESAPASRRR